jgi:peptidoglycan/xylan/chitin deacetylase (PgdA/CDA1 family)
VASEIERTSAAIKAATGYEPTVMRPPYGAVNSGLVDMMYNDYGLYTVLWDVDTRDWQKPGVSKVVSRAVGQAEPGSIILLHDIHASTLAAVEQIVVGLQQRGYKLVTVSQLIAMGRRASGEGGPATPEDATPAEIPVGLAPIDVVSSEPTAAAEISGQPAEQPAMTTSETN